MKSQHRQVTPKIRCAVYTRKSTDEGLDMEFNSLDAQREACENYVASQKAEGWLLVPDRYDDGGFSGGTLERPALKRLLADIAARRLDCVVVYKIDRLTRSLMDFAKLVESFEQGNVTFVSVTQHFNTTSSMGRLTLNILLSFSQFERELAAERIRDKFAASRKRGIWMGGHPPLGYDVRERKLVVNEAEAELVRHIFQRYVETRSTTILAQELTAAGQKSKSWTATSGRVREGTPFSNGTLLKLLSNRVYLGEAVHLGNAYPGEHEAIITRAVWDQVQAILESNAPRRPSHLRAQTAAPLKGVLRCGPCNRPMTPSHTRKGGRLYRYYTCQNAIKHGHAACRVKSIAAREIEGIVLGQLQALTHTPELVARTWKAARIQEGGITEREITQALRSLEPVWEALFPGEQHGLVELLVERVTVNLEAIDLQLRIEGLASLARDLGAPVEEKAA